MDVQGNRTHVVFPIKEAKRMFGDYVHQELKVGLDQADRGELVDWDPKKIKSQGRDTL